MPTLHLMVGLPGSGKTTRAKQLEQECNALRLTTDEWHYRLFGNDFGEGFDNDLHNERHSKIEQLMRETAERALQLGVDVILDFGCWARVERDELREKAHAVGAGFKIHYMACDKEELLKRLRERNKTVGKNEVFYITEENIDEWSGIFEPPDKEELSLN